MPKLNSFPRVILFITLLTSLLAGVSAPALVNEFVNAAPLKQAVPLSVIINEVAWAGTKANEGHEWIELYNPSLVNPVNLTGWTLQSSDLTPNIVFLVGVIPPGGYFLLERDTDGVVSNIPADLIYSGALANAGESLSLIDPLANVVDTANLNGGPWPAGDATTFGTMERIGTLVDSDSSWSTNNGVVKNGLDFNEDPIWGTPKNGNTPTPTPTATSSPTNTFTPTNTATTTYTFTPTPTLTPTRTITPTGTIFTPTNTGTPTATGTPTLGIIISEVAWMGTLASATDEWIELYNGGSTAVDLSGWTLKSTDSAIIIAFLSTDSDHIINPGQYFVVAPSSAFTDVFINKNISVSFDNNGKSLVLRNASGVLIDTANSDGGSWPAGSSSPNYATMERHAGTTLDSASNWYTFAGIPQKHDRSNNLVKGTPGYANWAVSVTATPTKTISPTPAPTRVPPKTALPPVGRPIINEFLARPGFDWNQDGKVNVYDEFIEIKNIGNADINIGSWKLDDEANLGSNPFTLPSVVLKVGERIVFYGLETNILLSDGGDTVRLLNPNNKVFDAYTYRIAKVEDQSVCRLPDGFGDWYENCVPTPNFTNTREGGIPSMPDGEVFESPVCDLPDTLPADFLFAECRGFGANIWDSFYWDKFGWQGIKFILEKTSKWESFVE